MWVLRVDRGLPKWVVSAFVALVGTVMIILMSCVYPHVLCLVVNSVLMTLTAHVHHAMGKFPMESLYLLIIIYAFRIALMATLKLGILELVRFALLTMKRPGILCLTLSVVLGIMVLEVSAWFPMGLNLQFSGGTISMV